MANSSASFDDCFPQAAADLQAAAAAFGVAMGRLSSLNSPRLADRHPCVLGVPRRCSASWDSNKQSELAEASRPAVRADSHVDKSCNTSKGKLSEREQQLLDCMTASFAAVNMQP